MKYTFVLLTLFTCLTLFSQDDSSVSSESISKGNWFIGGGSNLFFNSTNSEVESNGQTIDTGNDLRISLGVGAGYFVSNHLVVGMELPVSFSRRKDDDVGLNLRNTSFIASPFVRYYFNGTNIRPFIQGNIGFGISKSKNAVSNTITNPNDPVFFQPVDTTSDIFQYSFNGGIAIFISQKVSVDLGVGYSSTTSNPDTSDIKFKNNTIGFLAGFNIFL